MMTNNTTENPSNNCTVCTYFEYVKAIILISMLFGIIFFGGWGLWLSYSSRSLDTENFISLKPTLILGNDSFITKQPFTGVIIEIMDDKDQILYRVSTTEDTTTKRTEFRSVHLSTLVSFMIRNDSLPSAAKAHFRLHNSGSDVAEHTFKVVQSGKNIAFHDVNTNKELSSFKIEGNIVTQNKSSTQNI